MPAEPHHLALPRSVLRLDLASCGLRGGRRANGQRGTDPPMPSSALPGQFWIRRAARTPAGGYSRPTCLADFPARAAGCRTETRP